MIDSSFRNQASSNICNELYAKQHEEQQKLKREQGKN